jgi:hypothetical protein
MPGGARQLSVAAAVRAPAQVPSPRGRPGWPSAPRRCDPGEVGPPSGGRRREDVRTPATLVVPLSAPRSRRGTSVQPVERTSNVQCPVSGVQASGVQVSGVQVSGRTGLRCPRQCRRAVRVALDLEWLGVGGRRLGAVGRGAPGVRGRVVACIGPDGKRWCGGGRARLPRGRPSPRADAWPASRLRRRLAAGPTRAGPGPGCRPGGGARDAAGAHRSPRRASGRSPAWCPTMGLDQEVVTTLGGRKARGGPVASSSGGPTRFGGEQPAAAARPRCVRSAAR